MQAVYRFIDLTPDQRANHDNIFEPAALRDLGNLLAFVLARSEQYGRDALFQQLQGYLDGLPKEPPPKKKTDHSILLPFAIALAANTGRIIYQRANAKLEGLEKQGPTVAPTVAGPETPGTVSEPAVPGPENIVSASKPTWLAPQPTGKPTQLEMPTKEEIATEVLDSTGVGPDNPWYCDLVIGNNAHDAFRHGFDDERKASGMDAEFPAWQWITTMDGRQRPAHGARNENYYPANRSFTDIRDKPFYDGHNCRCITSVVPKDEWQRLQARGTTFSTFAEDAAGHDHGADGKFVTKGDGGQKADKGPDAPTISHPATTVELHEKAEPAARKRLTEFKAKLDQITDVPVARHVKMALAYCKEKTSQLYNALEKRYGRTTAIACMASGQAVGWGTTAVGAMLGVPLVIPGMSIIGSLPAVAAAELYLQLRGKHSEDQAVDMNQAQQIAKQFQQDLVAGLADYLKSHKFGELPVIAVRQQTGLTCGPAALTAVARYFDLPANEAYIRDLAGTSPEDGTSPEQMVTAAERLGLAVTPVQDLPISDLRRYLEAGIPVIACVQAYGSPAAMATSDSGHWVVLIGDSGSGVIMADSASSDGRAWLPWEQFKQRWHDKDGDGKQWNQFGIVIHGKSNE